MRFVSFALAVAASLMLASCYVSTKSLIASSDAVYPFAAPVTFKSFSMDEGDTDWKQSGGGQLLRNGDRYTLHPDPEEGRTPDPKDDFDFRLADLGDGYYAAEALEREDDTILLDVIKVEGDTVYQYVLMCVPEDKKLADDHVIDKYEHGEFNDTCTVSSLDQLKRAFRAKLAAGLTPRAKYLVTR